MNGPERIQKRRLTSEEADAIAKRMVRRSILAPVILAPVTLAAILVGPRLKAEVEDFGANVVDGVERLVDNFHSDSLKGQPIEGREEAEYKTINYDAGRPFPVRKHPDQSKQLGFAYPDQIVKAQAVYGSSYIGNYLGSQFVGEDGEVYGEWFKVDVLTIFKKTGSGEFERIGEVQGAYVSGNFLTAAPIESDNTSDAQ